MLRQFHSLVGLIATLVVSVLAISGAILSVQPALQYVTTPRVENLTVADLAARVSEHYRGIESLQRSASGSITVFFSNEQGNGVAHVNPLTGLSIAREDNSDVIIWVKELHRSLLLGERGRVVVAVVAGLLAILILSGAWLLVIRSGGWRLFFKPIRGPWSHRVHCGSGRFALLALLLTSLSGSYLSAVRFNILPGGQPGFPSFPTQVDAGAPLGVANLSALKSIKLTDLHELVYPYMGDPQDFFTLTTSQGTGYIDQATGELLSFQAHSNLYKLYEFIYRLHTGEGLWWLGLLLGITSLNLPLICASGVLMLWQRRSARPKLTHNSAVKTADTVILVGSEGNHTWGFAKALHDQLVIFGYQVRTTTMNQLEANYPKAERLFILTSTYGVGEAPASAKLFLQKLDKFSDGMPLNYALLGFGDRQFSLFGQYAKDVNQALTNKGFVAQYPLTLVDRQSAQEFVQWGRGIGKWLGQDLNITYTPERPVTFQFELIARTDYGDAVQAPTSIFRFRLVRPRPSSLYQRIMNYRSLTFDAGDFIGIFAPHNEVSRFYSLASSVGDGFIEICVRKQPGGICSSYLHGLAVGDAIKGFIRPNPAFRPQPGKAPVILIGAGAGIAPLLGFIRQNKAHRSLYLFWGGRHPQSDFLYQAQLQGYLETQYLTELNRVFSRIKNGHYVQDALMAQQDKIRMLIEQGGQVMICGGSIMGKEVKIAFEELLKPLGLSVASLIEQGKYREDVY